MKIISDKIRQKISEKILDFVEKTPDSKFEFITALKKIRLQQRQNINNALRIVPIPEESLLSLKQITLTLLFEFEDFFEIRKGLAKNFPNNNRVMEVIDNLKSNENKLYYSGWSQIALISKQQNSIFADQTKINLPDFISSLDMSYHRILPSVAIIRFDFYITDELANKINNIFNNNSLPEVIFQKFFPIHKLHHQFSIDNFINSTKVKILNEINFTKSKLIDWVSANFQYSKNIMNSASFIDFYEINKENISLHDFEELESKYHGYLNCYDIVAPINTFVREGVMFNDKDNDGCLNYTKIVTKLSKSIKSEEEFLFYKYNSVPFIIMCSLDNLLDNYLNRLEFLKAKGFIQIYKSHKDILNNISETQELKRLLIILNRMRQETNSSSLSIYDSIYCGDFKSNFPKCESIDLAKVFLSDIQQRLIMMSDIAEMLDTGLSSFIDAENIYATYKLQRTTFWLTVLATIVAVLSIISGWESLFKSIDTLVKNYIG